MREKDELTDKVGEYLAELKELRGKTQVSGDPQLSNIVSSMKFENEQLQKTIDDYLLKMSKLTFDNAKLQSQV